MSHSSRKLRSGNVKEIKVRKGKKSPTTESGPRKLARSPTLLAHVMGPRELFFLSIPLLMLLLLLHFLVVVALLQFLQRNFLRFFFEEIIGCTHVGCCCCFLVSTHVLMPCVGLWVSFPGFVWERWLEKESALAILSNGYRANRLIQLAGEEVYWEEV